MARLEDDAVESEWFDGNLRNAFEDFLESQVEPTGPADDPTVPTLNLTTDQDDEDLADTDLLDDSADQDDEDLADTDLLDDSELEPQFQAKPWCKNYQNYAEYLAANKKRGKDRLKTEQQFIADCQGQNVAYEKKPALKRGRIPEWAQMKTHQDVIDFYTEKDAQGKMKRRWPPPAKTYGKNIKIKQEWEDLTDVYGEVRKREKEAQKRFIQEERSKKDAFEGF
jgi:hypothetical protein